jgi:pimeloyl-ACP methyl ester carboxylesterase
MGPSTPTWVLLRGLTREHAHWGSFPAQLDAALTGARVLTLDLPGAGALHRERCPTTVAALVDACRAQSKALGVVAPVHVVGLSLGGMVALEWMHRWPGEVAGAVIVNSSARGLGPLHRRLRPANWPALLHIALRWGTREAEHRILRLTSAQPQRHVGLLGAWLSIRRQRPVSRANALRQLIAAARYRLARPDGAVRVLVAVGAADALVDPACSRRLAAALGADIAVHPQAGHDLPLDEGAWLAARIAQWVRDRSRPSAGAS